MRLPIYTFLLPFVISSACAETSQSNNPELSKSNPSLLDTTLTAPANQDDIHQFEHVNLYSISSSSNGVYYIEFIPLSEALQSGEEPEDLALPPYLMSDAHEIDPDTLFYLENEYRNSVLEFAGIDETDSVYVFDLAKNHIESFPVSAFRIVAFINPYGADLPYRKTDYIFGLDVTKRSEKGDRTYNRQEFASIEEFNPFIEGSAIRIEWNEINEADYPAELTIDWPEYSPTKCYSFAFEDYMYFARIYRKGQAEYGIKIDIRRGGQFIWSRTDYSSEGSDPILPMLYNNDNFSHWTGRWFRNKPPVLFNVYVVSFGCPAVYYIHEQGNVQSLICDNRH
ncbi:MAG: hypothetical protein HWD92_04935 [Flavobacteriia bacterium]|nr:hypothetical protein [Flavobacteriia bacterium]